MHAHLETLHQLYTSETQSFRKVHRMIDLFESIIKSHTVVVLGEYVKHNKLSDAAKGMLAQGLRTPSLGTWQLFSRVMFEELQADGYTWTFTDFPAEFAALDKALNADKTNVVAFRNGYAHGATPTDAQCEADIAKFDPFLKKLLECRWLTATHLETHDGKVWVVGDGAEVCVHPVLVHKADGGDVPYAFFNDLKNDRVGLLNYPLSKHYREKEFFKEFHECLPLHEWKKTGNNEFYQRIEELTETFKGRTLEREKLLQFVRENHKGYCSIQGNPGIGKSALIAQFFKDLRAQKELTDVQVVEYFIRRGTIQAQTEYVFNYLIRRTDELFAPGKEIRAEGKAVWDLQQQLFTKWRMWGEQCEGKKLLFLIDGLDEGTENNVVTYMPRENFEGVLIIYGSRPGGHKTIEDLWTQLPTEHHTKLELAGLGREDIRALIYEVANKYEVERESAWIDAVQQRSQGNPLYLKLLCDALEHGSIALNDIQALPDKIDEYYKAILDRYAADTVDGDALLAGLFTFAAARDYLTMAHLGLINKLGDATVQRIGSTLKEVLYENPLTEDVLDYQLFHESFREYLVKEKALKVKDAMERIIDFCGTWRELEGTWEQRYALQHYAAHAAASAREARATELLALPGNSAYIETQKKVLKQFDATKELYRLCLLKASELKQYDRQLEAALCLVDLKYEEANDAPQVVALVAAGDIDLALKRIESFGGTDKDGVKRRFTLYMLGLMELTLLESKTKPFRKTAIEKLLNHLDEHIPPDTSIMKWNDFFPSYLMFLMACEWAELGLDYLRVYKRTDIWAFPAQISYSDEQFDVLFECTQCISTEFSSSYVLAEISTNLAKQGKFKQSLVCARGILTKSLRITSQSRISTELAKCGNLIESHNLLQETLECALGMSNDYWKSSALEAISIELAKQGRIEDAFRTVEVISDNRCRSLPFVSISSAFAKEGQIEKAASAIQNAIESATHEIEKYNVLEEVSIELARQGKIEEALDCARSIISRTNKVAALSEITTELTANGRANESKKVMQEAILCSGSIRSASLKVDALLSIYTALSAQGNFEEAAILMQQALECAKESTGKYAYKTDSMYKRISTKLAVQGKIKEAVCMIEQTLLCAIGINSEFFKDRVLTEMAIEFTMLGKIEEALECARAIIDEYSRIAVLKDISTEMTKHSRIEEADSVIQEALDCARGLGYWEDKYLALKHISNALYKQGSNDEAGSVMKEALEFARGLSYKEDKSRALQDISCALHKQGRSEEADSVIQDALECARYISHESGKNHALKLITAAFTEQDKIEEAFECVLAISDSFNKNFALQSIVNVLAIKGRIAEAFECAATITDKSDRCMAMKDISTELAKQGRLEEALACARGISSDRAKSSTLKAISTELAKQGKVDEAASAMQEALTCARGISDESRKSYALNLISTELAIQGKTALAETTGLEIPQLAERHSCWKEIAENTHKESGWQVALQQSNQWKSDEARLFYLKGWAESASRQDANNACVQEALSELAHDSESIETLLQKHALHEVFFGKAGPDKINQLNRTLNIQWALDIAAQFPKEESATRLSTNLDTWLHEIEDEDDRDQIELWAKQVAKGKITEEEFGERVNRM